MKKSKLFLIGFLQALAVVSYCGFVGWLFNLLSQVFIAKPGFWGTALILSLLVVSAAITGSLVFVYPAYLVLKQRLKEAILILLFTSISLFSLIFILAIVLFSGK